jgi:hypothetical protein
MWSLHCDGGVLTSERNIRWIDTNWAVRLTQRTGENSLQQVFSLVYMISALKWKWLQQDLEISGMN